MDNRRHDRVIDGMRENARWRTHPGYRSFARIYRQRGTGRFRDIRVSIIIRDTRLAYLNRVKVDSLSELVFPCAIA